ncbi:SpoIIE family protein phosphatase [Streptomyces sp. NPDC001698]|uniref:SpoIIE family protein phosphatase n=1 Tax=Streptomyces sp. NPDC001698 TaxID=3364601 RepID=UPI0036CAE2CB
MTEQSMLSGLFTQSPVALIVYGLDTRVKWVNDVLQKIMGWHAGEYVGQDERVLFPRGEVLSPARYRYVPEVVEEVLRTGEPVVDVHWRGPTPAASESHQVWSCSYFRLQDGTGQPLGVCEAAVDVTARYEAQTRLTLLSRASRIGRVLDVTQTAEDLAGITVPDFADSLRIEVAESFLAGEDPLLLASGESAKLQLVLESTVGDRPIPTGRLMLGVIGKRLTAEGHRQLALPLLLGRSGLGIVTFVRQLPRTPFNDDDRALAEELVSRTAVCMDNARRYTRERTVALKLQRSLLPRDLPELSGIEIAHRYTPTTGPRGVGGDWYDVIPLSGARIGLVVGDVVGHGVDAAATMGRLRTSVRALAALDLAPDELLTRLDDMVGQERIGIHQKLGDEEEDRALGATCLYAVYDSTSGTCTAATAGHIPPVVAVRSTKADKAEPLDLPIGPPLGAGGLPFECAEFELAEGSLLALFTDGLVEARDRDIDAGVTDLCRALEHPHSSLQETCDAIMSHRAQRPAEDDAALLLVRAHALPDDSTAIWDLACDPAEVSRARALVGQQLEEWGLGEVMFVAELVVSELVTNAIRYGGPPISLRLLHDVDRTLICEVSDGSHTSPHLRRATTEDEGGRGLFLVAQLTDRWGTRYMRQGKTIWTEIRRGQHVSPDLSNTVAFGDASVRQVGGRPVDHC